MNSTTCGVGDLLTDIRASKPVFALSASAYLNSHPLACVYLRKRPEDARSLRDALCFRFNAIGQLCCDIYGHHIVLNNSNSKGYVRPRNSMALAHIEHVDQAIAYILAANW